MVERLPNEVADGSVLQRDGVERSPTLKSINLTDNFKPRLKEESVGVHHLCHFLASFKKTLCICCVVTVLSKYH